MNAAWVLVPPIIGRAIDDMRHAGISLHRIGVLALLLLLVSGTKAIFQFLIRWVLIGVSREIEFDLRNDLFKHLEGLSHSFYQRTRTGDIMAKATNDLNAVRMLLGPGFMYTANTIVFTAFALGFMLHISHRLTFYAFLPLPVVSVVIQYFGRRIHERFERIQAMFSEISARAQENFSGVRIIRAYAQEEAEIASFETANREYIARSLTLVRLMGMLWPTLETMLGLAIVLVLWLGGREVLLGPHDRRPIHRVQYFHGATYLAGDCAGLGDQYLPARNGVAGPNQPVDGRKAGDRGCSRMSLAEPADEEINGEIEFRNLQFSYDGTPILHDINLRIPAGSSLAIVGPTGSGKTTLVSLIPRIYDVEPGMVLIDGKSVREYPLAFLRRNIGFVPQETFLFGETIRENIAFGVPDASDQDVRWAAESANIATEIEDFPEQYKTIVGERGITLSGGQKQRTAIARALIRNPRILVLDDALSSVDTQTEDKILNHLREVMQGRTTIFISHRVSTVRNADRIAVLHSGRIVELGTHEELIARNGYYSDLYNKQLLEEELAEVS